MNTETLSTYLERIAPQVRHHSDGRNYQLQEKVFGKWMDLQAVTGTNLCDLATRWWLTNRTTKIRAMPRTSIV